MTANTPELEPGRVYRTREFAPWSRNAPRFVRRLVLRGELQEIAHGLYARPRCSRFGDVPPSDEELMRAFLDGAPFVFTGSTAWNALDLGTTPVFAMPLVYNTKRSGEFAFGKRRFLLRRVAFPAEPPAEWFVVDLFEHAQQAGTTLAHLAESLSRRLAEGRFDAARLRAMAERYGTLATRNAIRKALGSAQP